MSGKVLRAEQPFFFGGEALVAPVLASKPVVEEATEAA